MGQLRIPSGKLAIGDPVLGMAAGHNPSIEVPRGNYSVALTRMICLDKKNLEIPAYLSIIIDPSGLDLRRIRQKEAAAVEAFFGIPPRDLTEIGLLVDGALGEIEEEEQNLVSSRSGVMCMVDEESFYQRMSTLPQGGDHWLQRFFGTSQTSWIKILDGDDHLESGMANVTLPSGPDDWMDGGSPTIAMAQMLSPGEALILIEHHAETGGIVALHIELGLMAALSS